MQSCINTSMIVCEDERFTLREMKARVVKVPGQFHPLVYASGTRLISRCKNPNESSKRQKGTFFNFELASLKDQRFS